MIAGLSSSVFGAIRTAGEARARMDDATRQIATGKRVASVKDDGAAWARAAAMKADATTWSFRADTARRLEAVGDLVAVQLEGVTDVLSRAAVLLVQASETDPGSQRRAALHREWQSLVGEWQALGQARMQADAAWTFGSPSAAPVVTTPAYASPGGFDDWSYDVSVGDPVLSNLFMPHAWWAGGGTAQIGDATNAAYTPTVAAVEADFMNATRAQMIAAAAEQRGSTHHGVGRAMNHAARLSGAVLAARMMGDASADLETRLLDAADRLTDADLGAASTARASAETRQALAVQTVRMALDAYSAKATGLLANVQRTQRSVLA